MKEGELYQILLADRNFHELFLQFDHDIADAAGRQGCQCGGVLHSARYQRKAKGLPPGLDRKTYCWRFSFCCAVDGCRHRTTPPSLRFLGRRVYLATVVVLISALLYGPTPRRMQGLSQLFGVTYRTVGRWRKWWRTAFTESRFWQAARAQFIPPIDQQRLPATLLEGFANSAAERLLGLLRFLGPITGGAAVHVS
jgi:hypothetical protein